MSHKDGVMHFQLKKEIKYSKGGDLVSTAELEFYEFNAAHSRHYMKLKQFVDKAIFSAQKLADGRDSEPSIVGSKVEKFHETSEEKHNEEADGLAELLSISMSLSDDDDKIYKFTEAFKAMLFHSKAHSLCKIDGDMPINENHWNEIHPEDQINIAMKYCAFFGIGLLGSLKEESETVSEQHTEVKEL